MAGVRIRIRRIIGNSLRYFKPKLAAHQVLVAGSQNKNKMPAGGFIFRARKKKK